ncbi:Phosphate acyltransferase [Marinomonas spartinae]|uniref:Phosphate acyltransferase n=1 Tax=Marinomonas spartinae TaxID=1792290 RepID=A0A1A8TKC6_9GAMM|nr:fatty acid synthesis protein [Marinomonas spartinae]SBS34297.1 Phosphate acyltransferase [Marinomonas spartinae]SBS37574.1 Phosphate acyltransferase [Marinomonas spartinae]
MIRVALDAMGGDLGPRIAFESALEVLSQYPNVEITLYYSSYLTSECIPQIHHSRLTLVSCLDEIHAEDDIVLSLFKRRDSTLFKAIDSLRDGADVVVTFGNTGAVVALARHLLGVIRPKLYPALIRELHADPLRCLVDLGANVHCPASMLEGFAQLGAAYVEVLSSEAPKVGLLNVGVESTKGSSVIRQADTLLSEKTWPMYLGYAEGSELFHGEKNVIVCDGMVGNAVLKASEGLLSFLMKQLKEQGGDQSLFETFYQTKRRHGACLVGVNGNLVKGHGGSDLAAMIGAIEYGIDIAQADLAKAITARLDNEGSK